MQRVSAELALLALRQSGHNISPSTLRMWVHRGHITRGTGGYNLGEILAYLDQRAAEGTPGSGELVRSPPHHRVISRYSKGELPPRPPTHPR